MTMALQCNITKNSCEAVLVSDILRTMPSVAALTAFRDTHREAPLDNHAPEKSGQERPEEAKSCSEIEWFGVGFERKGARNSAFSLGHKPWRRSSQTAWRRASDSNRW
jgi:hypothetical protein